MKRLWIVALLVLTPQAARGANVEDTFRDCLRSGGDCVDSVSLTACVKKVDPVLKRFRESRHQLAGPSDSTRTFEEAVRLRVISILSAAWSPETECRSLERVTRVAAFLSKDAADLPLLDTGRTKVGTFPLTVGRDVLDEFDPKGETKTTFPAMASYSHDMVAGKEQTSLRAGVKARVRGSSRTASRWTTSMFVQPGVDLDISSSKPTDQTTIKLGLPVSILLTDGRTPTSLESILLTVTPSLATDREFDSSRWDATITLTAFAPLGMGLKHPLGMHDLAIYWLPRAALNWGEVTDAGTSASLATLKKDGRWFRLGGDLLGNLSFTINKIPVALDVAFQARYDRRAETFVTYLDSNFRVDFMKSGAVFLVANFTDGRKPPLLRPTNGWNLGLGVKF